MSFIETQCTTAFNSKASKTVFKALTLKQWKWQCCFHIQLGRRVRPTRFYLAQLARFLYRANDVQLLKIVHPHWLVSRFQLDRKDGILTITCVLISSDYNLYNNRTKFLSLLCTYLCECHNIYIIIIKILNNASYKIIKNTAQDECIKCTSCTARRRIARSRRQILMTY